MGDASFSEPPFHDLTSSVMNPVGHYLLMIIGEEWNDKKFFSRRFLNTDIPYTPILHLYFPFPNQVRGNQQLYSWLRNMVLYIMASEFAFLCCGCVCCFCVFVCLHNFLLITVFSKDGEKDVLVLYGWTDGKNIGREERKETVIRTCYIKITFN